MRMLLEWRILAVLTASLFRGAAPFDDYENRLHEDVRVRLPPPFVLKTSLGVNPEKSNSGHSFGGSNIEKMMRDNSDSPSTARGHDVLYNFNNNDLQKYVTSLPVRDDPSSPKIKFYTMKCSMGHQCNAIIPAHTTPAPPGKNSLRSDEEMRNYLKRYGLNNGFNYAKDDRANRNSVVARYFKGEDEKAKQTREAKKISTSFYDNPDYWPGSQYRPKYHGGFSQPKAKIYKYEARAPIPRSKAIPQANNWDSIQSANGAGNPDFHYTHELPSPSFSNPKPYPYPKEFPKAISGSSKGVWNRFSNSVVSQYDREKNDWVKISGSNKELSSGSVTVSSKPFNKPSPKPNNSIKGASITVLEGLPETGSSYQNYRPPSRPPHDSYNQHNDYDRPIHRPTYSTIPPSSYGRPTGPTYGHVYDHPTRPSYSFYSPSNYDHQTKPHGRPFPPPSPTAKSVSFPPLRVLPRLLKYPSIAFQGPYTRPNTTTDTTIAITTTELEVDSGTPNIPLAAEETTTTTTTTTHRPITTTRTTTTTTPVFREDGGGGGGGFVDNRYAVMAAVGAGLIPASIAALLPILVGRKRRRRRSSPLYHPLHLAPSPSEGGVPSSEDPLVNFLLGGSRPNINHNLR